MPLAKQQDANIAIQIRTTPYTFRAYTNTDAHTHNLISVQRALV